MDDVTNELRRVGDLLERLLAVLESPDAKDAGRRLLDVPSVARRLGCSHWKARQTMLKLPHARVGKLLKLDAAILDRYLARGGDDFETGAARLEPRRRSGGPLTVPVKRRMRLQPIQGKRPT